MRLNKKQTQALIAFAVVLVVYNNIAFVIPFHHGPSFWAGYVFGLIAILAQIPILLVAFHGDESAKSRFYGMPIARIGVIYAVVQLIVSFAAMCLAWIAGFPAWPVVLISLLLLAAAALGTIAANVTRDEIVRQDTQLKKDVSAMRELRSLGNSLVAQCQNAEAKAELRKLADTLNYSDPVSSAATEIIEGELKTALNEIQHAILDDDLPSIAPLCKKAGAMLAERNRLCKLNK